MRWLAKAMLNTVLWIVGLLGFTLVFPMALILAVTVSQYLEARATEACSNAGEGGNFICASWYDQCRAEGDCDFETYWPPLLRQWEAKWAAEKACLRRAWTDGQRRECVYGTNS